MRTRTYNAINTLVTINSDRSEGYQQAAHRTTSPELRIFFNYLSVQSTRFRTELMRCIKNKLRGKDADDESDLYPHQAEEIKFTDRDRSQILSVCEFREDATKRLYDELMMQPALLSKKVRNVIHKHRKELQRAHAAVRSLYFTL
jgi:uncharacterized protein (TIGR02284 family)